MIKLTAQSTKFIFVIFLLVMNIHFTANADVTLPKNTPNYLMIYESTIKGEIQLVAEIPNFIAKINFTDSNSNLEITSLPSNSKQLIDITEDIGPFKSKIANLFNIYVTGCDKNYLGVTIGYHGPQHGAYKGIIENTYFFNANNLNYVTKISGNYSDLSFLTKDNQKFDAQANKGLYIADCSNELSFSIIK